MWERQAWLLMANCLRCSSRPQRPSYVLQMGRGKAITARSSHPHPCRFLTPTHEDRSSGMLPSQGVPCLPIVKLFLPNIRHGYHSRISLPVVSLCFWLLTVPSPRVALEPYVPLTCSTKLTAQLQPSTPARSKVLESLTAVTVPFAVP